VRKFAELNFGLSTYFSQKVKWLHQTFHSAKT